MLRLVILNVIQTCRKNSWNIYNIVFPEVVSLKLCLYITFVFAISVP